MIYNYEVQKIFMYIIFINFILICELLIFIVPTVALQFPAGWKGDKVY